MLGIGVGDAVGAAAGYGGATVGIGLATDVADGEAATASAEGLGPPAFEQPMAATAIRAMNERVRMARPRAAAFGLGTTARASV
jgi:hypothetical protein